MSLEQFRKEMLPAIEAALKEAVQPADGARHEALRGMLAYHMGWEGEGAGPKASGKRIRPTLVLLSCAAAGGDWKKALPAAAAVELLHNFSLIHDDIQDDSKQRRGRPTLWAKWGVPQAINAGDAMFALAHMALEGLEKTSTREIYIEAARLLPRTSLQLTQGQHRLGEPSLAHRIFQIEVFPRARDLPGQRGFAALPGPVKDGDGVRPQEPANAMLQFCSLYHL